MVDTHFIRTHRQRLRVESAFRVRICCAFLVCGRISYDDGGSWGHCAAAILQRALQSGCDSRGLRSKIGWVHEEDHHGTHQHHNSARRINITFETHSSLLLRQEFITGKSRRIALTANPPREFPRRSD